MSINLSDYRFILDGVLEAYPDTPPSPSIWRYMLEWWPDNLLIHYSKRVEQLINSGMDWMAAEWQSFKYFVEDTRRFEQKNPHKLIQWHYPIQSEQVSLDESNCILADENFYSNLQRGAEYNSNLGPSANEQLDISDSELKKKLKETEDALKSGLALQKETTVKKRSSVKREPKQVKETKIKASKEERPSKRKSKFDSDMGALFS